MDKKIILVGTSEEKAIIAKLLINAAEFKILTIEEKSDMFLETTPTNYPPTFLDLDIMPDLGIIKTFPVENADYIYIAKRFITIKQYKAELLKNLLYLSSIFIETYKKIIYKTILYHRKCSMILKTFSNLRFA